jgi:hypothetical protein
MNSQRQLARVPPGGNVTLLAAFQYADLLGRDFWVAFRLGDYSRTWLECRQNGFHLLSPLNSDYYYQVLGCYQCLPLSIYASI